MTGIDGYKTYAVAGLAVAAVLYQAFFVEGGLTAEHVQTILGWSGLATVRSALKKV